VGCFCILDLGVFVSELVLWVDGLWCFSLVIGVVFGVSRCIIFVVVCVGCLVRALCVFVWSFGWMSLLLSCYMCLLLR